jgi:exodeoxyribonuclease VII small subunit
VTPKDKPDAPEAAAAQAENGAASYEHARDELAAVVARLESGGLSLDESLVLWERGEHLAVVCTRFLDGARERVDTALRRSEENAEP